MFMNHSQIPDGWYVKKLIETGEAIIGLTYSPKDVVQSGGIEVLRSSNVRNGRIVLDDLVRVSVKIPNKIVLQKGDILVCARNGSRRLIGKNARIDELNEGKTFGAFMCVYRSSNSDYMFWVFQTESFRKQVARDLGPTINQVTTGNLNTFKFAFPDKKEQKRIVTVLETWDEYLKKLDKKIELKKSIKKGLMQQLLVGKIRLPGFNEEWHTKELGEVLKYEQPSNYIVNSDKYSDVYSMPVLTANKSFILGYTNEDYGIYENMPVIIFDDFTVASKYVDFRFKVKSSAIKILKTKDKNTNLKFVYERMQILPYIVGEHKRNYISEYQYLDFKLPPIDEQNAITSLISSIDEEINLLESEATIVISQKKYLTDNLIAGRIRTPEALRVVNMEIQYA